jgi:hypothetical protein
MALITPRRSFLRAGLIGTLALATAGSLYRVIRHSDAPGEFIFDDQTRSVLNAIIPVVLMGAIDSSSSTVTAAIDRVQRAITGLPLTAQREIQDLFGLLTLAPSRRFLVGLPDDWPQAKQEDIEAFLNGWRQHRFGMLQNAYHALHDLITGSWYADESTWPFIGYPGPIRQLS